MEPNPTSERPRRQIPLARLLVAAVAFIAIVSCGPANADGVPRDPLDVKPAATTVLALEDDLTFAYMPDTSVSNLEWDVEVEYDTSDVRSVFDHYDAELIAQGFERTSLDEVGDEIEADYLDGTTGVTVDLEVDRDDGRVDVDLDVENPASFDSPPAGFSLMEFSGLEIPFYTDPVDLEWDFNFDHPATGAEAAFAFYDAQLQDMGWRQIELDDDDDDEWEAEYELDGVYLELEAEGDTEIEIEVNKLRFY